MEHLGDNPEDTLPSAPFIPPAREQLHPKRQRGAQTRAVVPLPIRSCACVVFWNQLNTCEREFNQKRKYKQSGCILLQSTIFKAGRHVLNEKTFSSYQ